MPPADRNFEFAATGRVDIHRMAQWARVIGAWRRRRKPRPAPPRPSGPRGLRPRRCPATATAARKCKHMILVPLFDLKLRNRARGKWGRNLESAAPAAAKGR